MADPQPEGGSKTGLYDPTVIGVAANIGQTVVDIGAEVESRPWLKYGLNALGYAFEIGTAVLSGGAIGAAKAALRAAVGDAISAAAINGLANSIQGAGYSARHSQNAAIGGLAIGALIVSAPGLVKFAIDAAGKVGKFVRRLAANESGSVPRPRSHLDFPDIGRAISFQKQGRHVLGANEYKPGKSYFDNFDDPQTILDAFHDGRVTVVGVGNNNAPRIRYDGVSGTHVQKGVATPTSIFEIREQSAASAYSPKAQLKEGERMENKFGFDEWDAAMLALVKAADGNITHNFRTIAIDKKDGKWLLHFQLYKDDSEDRALINDIGSEWYSYLEDYNVGVTLDDLCPDNIIVGDGTVSLFDNRASNAISFQ